MQFGSPSSENVRAAASDGAGGVFLVGDTTGPFGGPYQGGTYDFWIARIDGSANVLWVRQVGSNEKDQARAVVEDGFGGAYVGAYTEGDLTGNGLPPNADYALARFDGSGTMQWIVQSGTTAGDSLSALASDGQLGVYAGGERFSATWLSHFDPSGGMTWEKFYALMPAASIEGAADDGAGGFFVTGSAVNDFGGQHVGSSDVWVARIGAPCITPVASYCTAKPTSSGCVPVLVGAGEARISYGPSFTITASSLEQDRNGLLVFGTSGQASTPFLGGTLCVASPRYVLPPSSTQGTVPCTGTLTRTFGELLAHPQGGPLIQAGAAVDCQVWFRDLADPFGAGLTAGLEFTPCP